MYIQLPLLPEEVWWLVPAKKLKRNCFEAES
jgi:hypothetical protein